LCSCWTIITSSQTKQGYTNQRIAREMCITVDTVKTHTKNIYEKLGVNNRTQAISLVIERGIL